MSDEPLIQPAQMCQKHQKLLVAQTGYGPDSPWRVLIIMAQVALFQAATAHPSTYERIGGDVGRIGELGCLACDRPEAFGEIIETVNSKGLESLKALGDSWGKGERKI